MPSYPGAEILRLSTVEAISERVVGRRKKKTGTGSGEKDVKGTGGCSALLANLFAMLQK